MSGIPTKKRQASIAQIGSILEERSLKALLFGGGISDLKRKDKSQKVFENTNDAMYSCTLCLKMVIKRFSESML